MNIVLPDRRLILPPKGLLVPRLAVARRRFGPPRRPSTMHQMLLSMGGGGGGGPLAFDNATGDPDTGATPNPRTFSHTCNGSNRALIVAVEYTTGGGSLGAVGVSALTYNGVSLTQIIRQVVSDELAIELWKLSNPASGANTVSITFDDLVFSAAAALSFTGAHQTTASLTGTAASNTGTNSSPTVNVSSAAGEIVVDGFGLRRNTDFTPNGDPAAGAGQTRHTHDASNISCYSSTEAGAASVTMSWSYTLNSGTTYWAIAGVSVKPA